VLKISVHSRELGSPSPDNLEIQGTAFDLRSELIEESRRFQNDGLYNEDPNQEEIDQIRKKLSNSSLNEDFQLKGRDENFDSDSKLLTSGEHQIDVWKPVVCKQT
jgi:hypothetical protein